MTTEQAPANNEKPLSAKELARKRRADFTEGMKNAFGDVNSYLRREKKLKTIEQFLDEL